MKKFVKYFSILLASASFADCQTTEIDKVEETLVGAQEFEVFASIPETKTVNDGMSTKWAEGDTISIFHAEAGTTNYVNDGKFTVANPQTGRFSGTISETLSAQSYDWYSIYPYTFQKLTPAGGNKGYIYFGCNSKHSQTQDGNDSMAHLCGVNVPMYGVVKGVAKNVSPALVQHQLASVVQVHVTNNTSSDLSVTNVKFTATEDVIGTYYVDITGDKVTYTKSGDSYVSNTAELSVENATALANGASADFYIVIKPFSASTGELKVSVNGYERTISLEKDVLFAAGKIKTINFNYDNEVAPATGKYVKVTSTSDLADGKYLIVYETDSVALNGALTSDVVSNTVKVSISNGEIASTSVIDAAAVIYKTADGSFLGGGGKYIGHTGTSNTLNYFDSAFENDVTFDSGNVVINAGSSYVLRYNKSSGQERFRYYKGTQEAIQLYKYIESTTPTPAPTLTSIEVKTAPTKVAYTAGETFDPTGLVITKHMSDETTEDVAYTGHESEFSFSPSLSTALATADVKVTITYGGKSVDQSITVNQNGGGQGGETKTLICDFENESNDNWDIYNFVRTSSSGGTAPHSGSYFSNTSGKESGYVVTKSVIANPQSISFYVSKESTNTNASSVWKVQISSDGTSWSDAAESYPAGASVTKNKWTEYSADLKNYSNVYIKVAYSGTSAIRDIDDVILTFSE